MGNISMELAYITPEILRWAIQRAGSTTEKVAKKLRARTADVAAWQDGNAHPPFSSAEKLADILNVPFGYLFLNSPPKERIPLPDFRTVPGKRLKPSPNLIDLANDVIVKQEWYRNFLLTHGADTLDFVGSRSISDDPSAIAANIRDAVGIGADLRRKSTGWADFFSAAVRAVMDARILVMRSGIVGGNTHRRLSVREFRGFAIGDQIAPLIFINSRDWPKAQLFTLAHELAHIWIGKSGISNEDLRNLDSPNVVERVCNSIAAEVLCPQAEMISLWNESSTVDTNLRELASHFRVSSPVVLRRAFDLGKINDREYFSRFKQERIKDGQRSSGGSFYNSFFARNSPRFARAVVSQAMSGKLLYRDASNLLNIGVPTIQKIAKRLERPEKET